MAMPERLAFPRRIPFAETLGLELWRFGAGHAELAIELAPALHNSFGVAHGGVLMTLLDVAMARAATSHPDAPTRAVVTVEMSTRFVRPGRGPLRAEGLVLHLAASLCTTEAHVFDASGARVASAMGTFKFWRAPRRGID